MKSAEERARERFQFDTVRKQPWRHLPIVQTMHPPLMPDGTHHQTSFKRCLVLVIPSEHWMDDRCTHGMSKSSLDSRLSVSLFLKCLHWAIQSNICTYVEVLYDSVLAEQGIYKEQGKRLFIPISDMKYPLFQHVSLTSLKPPEEDESPAKRFKKDDDIDEKQLLYDSYVSHKLIDKESVFLNTVHRLFMCRQEHYVKRIKFDMVGSGTTGGENNEDDDDFSQDTVIDILDYRKSFQDGQMSEFYKSARISERQQNVANYINEVDNIFFVNHAVSTSKYLFEMIMIRPDEGFLKNDADNLRYYVQQSHQVSCKKIKKRLVHMANNAGLRGRCDYHRMKDDEILELFLPTEEEEPLLVDFAQVGPHIEASNPYSSSKGLSMSDQLSSELTPVAHVTKKRNSRLRSSVLRLVATGKLDVDEIDRIDVNVAGDVDNALNNDQCGVPSMYSKVWSAREALIDTFEEDESDGYEEQSIPKLAKALFWFKGLVSDSVDADRMSFVDQFFCVFVDILTSQLNATPQQTRVILKCSMYGATLLRHFYGPVNGVCMQGISDVGKTICAKLFIMMFVKCQIETESDASEKADIVQDNDMKVVWRDEMTFGGDKEVGKGSTKVNRMQSSMSLAFTKYVMFKLGTKKGDANHAEEIYASGRCFFLATVNKRLNSALRSRFDIEESYQDGKSKKGRKKTEEATKDPNRDSKKAGQLAMQMITSGWVKFWVVEMVGGLTKIDFTCFEVFCAALSSFFGSKGLPELMCRDIDKLRNLSLGALVMRVMCTLDNAEENRHIMDQPDVFVPHVIKEGCVVQFQDVLKAYHIAKPTNSENRTDRLLRVALKAKIDMKPGPVTIAEEDPRNQYYVTSLIKKNTAEELTTVIGYMDSTAKVPQDMMDGAVKRHMEMSIMSAPCLVYKSNGGPQPVLWVKKELVDSTHVMTKTDESILSILHEFVTTHDRTTHWNISFDEKDYLFSPALLRAFKGGLELTNSFLDDFYSSLDERTGSSESTRCSSLFWMSRMKTASGRNVMGFDEDYSQIFLKDEPSRYSEPCLAEGMFAGKHKTLLPYSGSFRVDKTFLDDYTRSSNTDDITGTTAEFIDMIYEISGEGKPGDVVFAGCSESVDENIPPSRKYVLRPWGKTITILNPERGNAPSCLDSSKLLDDNPILPQNKINITFDQNSNITAKMLDHINRGFNTALSYKQSDERYQKIKREWQ